MFEADYRTTPVTGLYGRITLIHTGLTNTIRHTRLRAKDTVVGNLDMSRYAHLTDAQKQEILAKAHNVRSEREMHNLVASLANGIMQ